MPVDLVRALSDGNAKFNPAATDWCGAAMTCRPASVYLMYQFLFGNTKQNQLSVSFHLATATSQIGSLDPLNPLAQQFDRLGDRRLQSQRVKSQATA
jgi:hypothetical protein